MSNITWKYTSSIINESAVSDFEAKYNFHIQPDLKACIEQNNAGMPFPNVLDFIGRKGAVFGGLLSFNEEDDDNIYSSIHIFLNDADDALKMLPFGLDPSGNFYCADKDGKIIFYDHELDRATLICDTFTDFLNMLYSAE